MKSRNPHSIYDNRKLVVIKEPDAPALYIGLLGGKEPVNIVVNLETFETTNHLTSNKAMDKMDDINMEYKIRYITFS
ncbi:MAG: hypothetical protein KGJ90_06420 [Patescibacteria group bacterium]|nr:hypothetical protein [Patescibacteria group bacterium]